MEWFRLYAEFATDPKVQMLPEAMQRRLVMLFCLQCSNGIETFHETERDASIAFALRITEEEATATKEAFMRKGFIDSAWRLCNWKDRQYASDSSTARVRKHREKAKQDETELKRSSNALEQNRAEQNRTDLSANASVPSAASASPGDLLDDESDDQGQNPGVQAKPVPACPVGRIVAAYHELMPNNPKARVIDDARKKAIAARWRQAAALDVQPFGYDECEQGLLAWRTFFAVCAESDFLTGQGKPQEGRPPFIADIDFLMSPSGFKKCLENKYHREAA